MVEVQKQSNRKINPVGAAGVVIFLWLGYTVLQTFFVIGYFKDFWSAILGFFPGILGVIVLFVSGLSRQDCFLVVKPLSLRGFGVLVGIYIFALAAILPFSVWQGWSWKAALLYAPASGVSQELFFRAALLPAMQILMKRRKGMGLLTHSVLFGLWHIGPLFVGAPLWAVMAVMLVPFLSGIGWGWQVQQDRTVLWAMIQHSLIWVVCNQFAVVS
jgi:membrane protease YdiL (CAAX protease family)